MAQTGPLDQPDAGEMAAYAAMFWQLKDTGAPDANAATFAFSEPVFNSPLFSPWRGALRKIQAAKGIGVGSPESCWDAPGSVTDADIRMFMLEGKIETPLDRTAEIAAHLQALLEALGQGQDVAVSIDNGSLVTVGLDPQTLQLVPLATAPTPTIAEIAELLAVVVPAAHDLAAAQDLSEVVRDPLVGNKPYWHAFMRDLQLSLGSVVGTLDAHVSAVDAAFGQYGSLVLARVHTNLGVYLLVDTVNGTVAGPFSSSAPYDARALLATHPEYQEGQTIEYFSKGDCATNYPVADTRWPVPGTLPPAGWVPLTPIPTNPTLGRPGYWVCSLVGGVCTFTSTYTYDWPGPGGCPGKGPTGWTPPMVTLPCLIFQTVTCTSTAPCWPAGCPDGLPNSIWPPPPPAGPGPIAPGCTPTCSPLWWYWI